ncbi:MAG: DHCW motif cupin fold protein [Chitinophagaceae bacterium]|nr:DHCW motif cupin fold protein [Chitinophagaceae bacterium]
MQLASFPFQTLDWSSIPKEIHTGTTGEAYWQIFKMGNIRIRKVEYSPNYIADHWCQKGHILHCVEGALETVLQDGRRFTLLSGMTYFVGDNDEPHQSMTKAGCKLFIVD